MKRSIGVIGTGFVGTAVVEGMKHAFTIETYDIEKPSSCSTVKELCSKTDIIFVCVPTPMRPSGESATFIVESVIRDITMACLILQNEGQTHMPTVVIKSTVPPGTTKRMDSFIEDEFSSGPRPHVVFNPEFLTEANFIDDFKNQNRIIIGGECRDAVLTLSRLYNSSYPGVEQVLMKSVDAEMVKYTTNIFLATKVSLANELYQVCQKVGADYDSMVIAAQLDPRLGTSHWKVPGPDGSYGFGLSCFPKDLNALMWVARCNGINPRIMQAVWDKNLEVRPVAERDWERMKKASVTAEEDAA
jgi:UDPglucose 6-dehydrogenase